MGARLCCECSECFDEECAAECDECGCHDPTLDELREEWDKEP